MKIQEHAGAGSGRASAPAQPGGERLPSAPRERKPALAALAVLLILVGALGATILVLRAGDRVEVIKITKDVPAGKRIPSSAMTSVMVADDNDIQYVKYGQRDQLANYRATTDIVKGSLLVGPMLTAKSATLPDGKVLVGLSLKAGQYPGDLATGDTVSAYQVGDPDKGSSDTTSGSGSSVLAQQAKVRAVNSGGDSGSDELSVSLLVNQDDAAALTQAAAAGEVSVVKVGQSGG